MATSEQVRLQTLLDKSEMFIQREFIKFLTTLRSDAVLKQFNDALESNDINKVYDIINSHVIVFANTIPLLFSQVAAAEAVIYVSQLKNVGMGIGFDPTNPRAAEKVRQARFDIIRGLNLQQRQATQQAIARAFETGFNPRIVAREIRNSIGLTAQQESAVNNYRAMLQSRNSDALQRELRDRRFDRTVSRSIRDETPLTAAQIDIMTNAYRRNMLAFRTETIARTQAVRATSEARQESLVQVMDFIAETHEAIREWDWTDDDRTRDHHRHMMVARAGLTTPFVDGLGNTLMFPGDPSAPAASTANCRCTFTVRIVEKGDKPPI